MTKMAFSQHCFKDNNFPLIAGGLIRNSIPRIQCPCFYLLVFTPANKEPNAQNKVRMIAIEIHTSTQPTHTHTQSTVVYAHSIANPLDLSDHFLATLPKYSQLLVCYKPARKESHCTFSYWFLVRLSSSFNKHTIS